MMKGMRQKGKQRKNPFFSVVIPSYNRKSTVIRAIKSVLKQSCSDYEIIVVDDGSTDGTIKKVKEKFGSSVRLIRQRNQGPSAARNKGIRHARGKHIAFLDSDDEFLPHKLKQNMRYLRKHPQCQFLHSWYYDLRSGGKKIKVQKPKSCKNLTHFQHSLFRRKFTIRTSTVVIKRSCFKKVGAFNTTYRYSQDWDMWLRLASRHLGHCQKKPLVKYYRYKKKRNERKIRRYHRKIKKNILKLYQWRRKTIKKLDRKYGKG